MRNRLGLGSSFCQSHWSVGAPMMMRTQKVSTHIWNQREVDYSAEPEVLWSILKWINLANIWKRPIKLAFHMSMSDWNMKKNSSLSRNRSICYWVVKKERKSWKRSDSSEHMSAKWIQYNEERRSKNKSSLSWKSLSWWWMRLHRSRKRTCIEGFLKEKF